MASEYAPTTAQLFNNAAQAMGKASEVASNISPGFHPTLKEPGLTYTPGTKNFGAAPQFADLFAGGDNSNALIAQLNDQVDAWLAKYFPSINGQFQNVPEDYLVNVISGVKPFGVASTVFDLVWHQARDRVYRTTQSETRTLEASFSSQGFTLPAGALLDAVTQSEQRATEAILNVTRDQAIKEADIKVDLLKHAVGIAAQLKMGILNTSAEFFKAYYSVHGLANEVARIRAQAYQSFYQALSSYYNVEVSWEDLRLRSAEATANVGVANDRNRVTMYSQTDTGNAARAQAARGFADVAATANAAAGTLVAQIEAV
jgi:hypothetical protein